MSVVYASFGAGVAVCEAVAGPGSALASLPITSTTTSSTSALALALPSPTSTTSTTTSLRQQLAWPLIGLPTTGAAFLYYALRPQAASRDACQRMSPAPISMLQRAWTSLDTPLTRWAATALIAHRQGLVYQRRLTIAGVPCTLMSRADPATFRAPRLLFFVHGGGCVRASVWGGGGVYRCFVDLLLCGCCSFSSSSLTAAGACVHCGVDVCFFGGLSMFRRFDVRLFSFVRSLPASSLWWMVAI